MAQINNSMGNSAPASQESWNLWSWIRGLFGNQNSPSSSQPTNVSSDASYNAFMQNNATNLFNGMPTIPSSNFWYMPESEGTQNPSAFYNIISRLVQTFPFLYPLLRSPTFPENNGPMVPPYQNDGRKFLSLDANDDIVIDGTRRNDNIAYSVDSETGDSIVEINGEQFWIKKEDMAKVRGFIVHGGDGNDTLDFSQGGPELSGKLYLYGDQGDDRIMGSDGNDRIYGGEGVDTIEARNGDDFIDVKDEVLNNGHIIRDQVDTGEGNDTVLKNLLDKVDKGRKE